MNFKTTYILFGILGTVVIVFFLVLWLGPTRADLNEWVLPSVQEAKPKKIAVEDIDYVEVDRTRPKAEKLVFERDGNKHWRMTKPASYRVNQGAVETLVGQVLQAKRDEHADLSNDLKKWELDPPAAVVTIKKGDQEWKISLGSEIMNDVYVTSSDRPKEALAVRMTDLGYLFKRANDFRDLGLAGGELQFISLQQKGKKPVALQKVDKIRWRFTEPAGYGDADMGLTGPGPSGGLTMRGVLEAVEGAGRPSLLRLEASGDFITDNASDQELTDKQLTPDTCEWRIDFKTVGSDALHKLLIGKAADEAKKYVYARLEDDRTIVKVPAASLQLLEKVVAKPEDLRDKNLLPGLAQARFDAIDIKAPKFAFDLKTANGRDWTLNRAGPPAQENSADGQKVAALGAALQTARISDFGGKVEGDKIVVRLWAAGKKPSDMKADKPTVELTFPAARPAGNLVSVERKILTGDQVDGPVLIQVETALWDLVSREPVAYRSAEIMPFTNNGLNEVSRDVTKVEIRRPDNTFVIEKETKDGKPVWKITSPEEFKGRLANTLNVEGILRIINWRLQVRSVEKENPGDKDLEEAGLKSPEYSMTVYVTQGGKTEPYEILFGKKQGEGRLATQVNPKNKHDTIVLVAGDISEVLKQELLDTTLFAFNPDEVAGLKVTGWSKRYEGAPKTVELERQDAQMWTLKAAQSWILDPSKAEGLTVMLSSLKAQGFLGKNDPKPDNKIFDPANPTLDVVEVTITFKGGKPPLSLTIGSEAPDGQNYYGKSNQVNGLFLLGKDRFSKLVEGSKYFAKGS